MALCLLIAPAVVEAQQCCGDCNGNRAVAVNELVTAVTNATEGCRRGQACCGDCDGNRAVAIGEVVTSVGHATGGCPGRATATPVPTKTPRPTVTSRPTLTPVLLGCPVDFQDDAREPGVALCAFSGAFNRTCGNDLVGGFVSDGSFVTFVFVNPRAYIEAQVTGPGDARIRGYYTRSDGRDFVAIRGTARLSSNGSILLVEPSTAPFTVGGCPFTAYLGVFAGIADESTARRSDPELRGAVEGIRPHDH